MTTTQEDLSLEDKKNLEEKRKIEKEKQRKGILMGGDYLRKIHPRNWGFFGVLLVMEIIIFILFGIFVAYDNNFSSVLSNGNPRRMDNNYKFYMDITTMVFIGTGYLYTFMKKYSFSGVGMTYLIGAFCIQWHILVEGLFLYFKGTETKNIASGIQKIYLNIPTLINANFGALAVLISFGAVLGKANPLQLLFMAIIEICFYCVNVYIGQFTLEASDVGGTMFIHTFGAYFGLACSYTMGHAWQVLPNAKKNTFKTKDTYLFTMIGTVVLFISWPSFNAAYCPNGLQHVCAINTILCLATCTAFAFLTSKFLTNSKFQIYQVQHAALAGGVAVGVSCVVFSPVASQVLGACIGMISVFGYAFLTPLLEKYFNLHDSCGIHNLHGIPGVIGAIVGAIALGIEAPRFPAFFSRGAYQVGYNFEALFITLVIAIAGGALTGIFIKFMFPEKSFMDSLHWVETGESDEDEDSNQQSQKPEKKE